MALMRGAKRCFEWLRTKQGGDIVSKQEVMDASGWSDVSLATYLRKNKLAPFLLELADGNIKVLLDGTDITEHYFDEVFTQTAPAKIAPAVGDKLVSERGAYKLVEPLGSGAVGHVWSARADNRGVGNLVAAKVMLPREDLLAESQIGDLRQRFRREARNGPLLSHKNIVRLSRCRRSSGQSISDHGTRYVVGRQTAKPICDLTNGISTHSQ
jgi:hypothetical protein